MDFVSAATRGQPYRDLVRDLSLEAGLTDDTDVNCDVCFSYVVEAEPLLFVRLSMVGPYALLERLGPDGGRELITTGKDCASGTERAVHHLLVRHGLTLPSAAQLAAPVELDLPYVEDASVYHALFTQEGTPPGS